VSFAGIQIKHDTKREIIQMNVTIVGTGNVARGVATRLLAGGNSVTLLARSLEPAGELVSSLQKAAKGDATVRVAPVGSDIEDDIVVLAVPYTAVKEIISQNREQLTGKIVIDPTNPLNATYSGLVTPADSSAAEEIAKLLPSGARVVKAFNTTFAGTVAAGQVAGQPLDVFIAGDDAEAKATVSKLVEEGGLRAIDAGPLTRAHQLEAIAFLHISLQSTLGTGFGSTIRIAA
jgi:NADPH-dependent F420 reductase